MRTRLRELRIFEGVTCSLELAFLRTGQMQQAKRRLDGEPVGDDGFMHVAVPHRNVVDAAVVPSALGVNPSLTIAAVAESIADRLIHGAGTESLADRLA